MAEKRFVTQHPPYRHPIRADQTPCWSSRREDEGKGERTNPPNSRNDEPPWVLGARGIPHCFHLASSFSISLSSSPPHTPTHTLTPLFPFKSLLLSSLAAAISFPGSSFTLGNLLLLGTPFRTATAVATTSITNTTNNVHPLSPTKPPTSTNSPPDCWAFPSRPCSLSLRGSSIYSSPSSSLVAPRATGIYLPRYFLLPSLPFSFLDRVLPFFLISLVPPSPGDDYPMVSNGLNLVEVSFG